jgi:hypothetical protein
MNFLQSYLALVMYTAFVKLTRWVKKAKRSKGRAAAKFESDVNERLILNEVVEGTDSSKEQRFVKDLKWEYAASGGKYKLKNSTCNGKDVGGKKLNKINRRISKSYKQVIKYISLYEVEQAPCQIDEQEDQLESIWLG